MNVTSSTELHCIVCGKVFARSKLMPIDAVRPQIAELIAREVTGSISEGFICRPDMNRFRHTYVENLLVQERGDLDDLERAVVQSIAKHDTLSANTNKTFDGTITFGQRMSDRIASFGGSWPFIIMFVGIISFWIVLNRDITEAFDPFPYILLNLVLSCVAALQAPIILMSQNREAAKDRLRSENDFRVNLKAELEIRHLHEKLDHLLSKQWERLAAIQQVQLELMEERRG